MEQAKDSRQIQEIKAKLGDPWWRLNNLYWITNEAGEKVKFKPNWAQEDLYRRMWYLNIILKARQLGFTTFIQIFMLDRAIFNSNTRCGVIAQGQKEAETFFRDKIKYAYDNLPAWLKAERPALKNDAGELLLANNSSVRVATSMRSGTLQYLHVSEHGKICRKYPEKAKEIRTGSLNAVHPGHFVFIESTAEGRDGDFFKMTQTARNLEKEGRDLTKMDYKFHFYPWWRDPRYQLNPKGVAIPPKVVEYFQKLNLKHGIELSARQMAWYTKKQAEQQDDMKQEFPSTPDEAFEASIEGAFYATQMTWLRNNKRITEVPWEPSLPVNTFWDIGMNDAMAIWFHQRHGTSNRLIDYYENSGEGFDHYAGILKAKGYHYGKHYLPHDVNVRELGVEGGRSREQSLILLGVSPIDKIPRARNLDEVLQGIAAVRQFLMTCWIDSTTCTDGIKALDNYRKQWDESAGTWKKGPIERHWSKHGSDALRTGAVGFKAISEAAEADIMPEYVEDY